MDSFPVSMIFLCGSESVVFVGVSFFWFKPNQFFGGKEPFGALKCIKYGLFLTTKFND